MATKFCALGQGYAIETAVGALAVGFNKLQLREIVAFTPVLNNRSQAVMARLEMSRDAATFVHLSGPEDSLLKEHCVYGIKRDTWLRAKNQPQ